MKILLIFLIFITVEIIYSDESYLEYSYDEVFELEDTSGKTPLDVIADGFLNVPQLIKKYGYPVENHTVITSDGYILELHRIPKPGKTPVLLMHGLLDSSAAFIISGPKDALGYYLSDEGYDVWLGNVRGNRYCRKHSYLSVRSTEFWDFSFHEFGTFDTPAIIDYIIEETGFKKIHYVGHSQGNTQLFVMCSERPGYCDKLISLQALAPVCYLRHFRSPLFLALAMVEEPMEFFAKIFGMKEFLPNNDIMKLAGQLLCKEESIIQPLCYNIMFLLMGYDSEQLNKTMLPAILGHIPAGTSTKTIFHYDQHYGTDNFSMYNYGKLRNLLKYGKLHPPEYDVKKTTVPVRIYYAMNDLVADTEDVMRLAEELPNVESRYLVPFPKFNHMDFLYAIDSRKLVYDEVVKSLKSYEETTKV